MKTDKQKIQYWMNENARSQKIGTRAVLFMGLLSVLLSIGYSKRIENLKNMFANEKQEILEKRRSSNKIDAPFADNDIVVNTNLNMVLLDSFIQRPVY